MMHLQQNVFNGKRLTIPTAENSTMAVKGFAVMEERIRFACEIHDTLAQAFAGILLHLEAVPTGRQLSSVQAKGLERARQLAKCGLEDSRRMLLGLRPKSLDGSNLLEALKAVAHSCAGEWGILCKFGFIGQETDLSPDIQDELYRIAQEALRNVRKHARATSVSILLSCESDTVTLTIRDNGQGFAAEPPGADRQGFGLTSMRARALRIGGSMDISSAPRRGTEVRVRVLLPGIISKGDASRCRSSTEKIGE